jgi:UDP-N-acetylglucosamine 1-carboxyvinyltransferase
MCSILSQLGAKIKRRGTTYSVDTTQIASSHIPSALMRKIRSSIFLMGPLLARMRQVSLSRPGGCAIGQRPIDMHLQALRSLGAHIWEEEGLVCCKAPQLVGTELRLPFPSVGATENAMMAAVLAKGKTIISNAALEPEIVDLQLFLNSMGAQITGAGTPTIVIDGVKELRPASHTIIPDRIVAGTFAIAAGVTKGELILKRVIPDHLGGVLDVLRQIGLDIQSDNDELWVRARKNKLRALTEVITQPYPGFPTDLQPQLLVLLALAAGKSKLTESIFESRLRHVGELIKLGAQMQVQGNQVWINGVSGFQGTEVQATDLRAGAALVLAGLAAQGTTIVHGIEYIDRGYESLEKVLYQLGAQIRRVKDQEIAQLV